MKSTEGPVTWAVQTAAFPKGSWTGLQSGPASASSGGRGVGASEPQTRGRRCSEKADAGCRSAARSEGQHRGDTRATSHLPGAMAVPHKALLQLHHVQEERFGKVV